MDRLRNAALITRLIKELRIAESWCGETDIQKSVYFLQELYKVPLGYEFVLYKHGPFSFGLRDELTSFRADVLIELEIEWPYGPRIMFTDRSVRIQKLRSLTVKKFEKQIVFIAGYFGRRSVLDLERLATILFLKLKSGNDAAPEHLCNRLTELKPHISMDDAYRAYNEIEGIFDSTEYKSAAGSSD